MNKKSADPLPMQPMKTPAAAHELLSALADNQLNDQEFDTALLACVHDDTALDCWRTYHLIGEVLRLPAEAPASIAVDAELTFFTRLNMRLADEKRMPVALIPLVALDAPEKPATDLLHHRGPASNDRIFRWKLVAGVASLAAVSAIAWNASALLSPGPLPQLARASSPQIVVTSPQGPMVRDARLEEMLAAHKQFGTGSAFQESSGFLRNATFELLPGAQVASGR